MKNNIFINIVFLIFLIIGCKDNSNRLSQDASNQIDELFKDWGNDEPGGAVGVVRNGVLVYERYFGLANIETEERFDRNTFIDIGSISKQFTACLIALLEEENKISIQDDIRKYLPELPAYQDTIKIKHLLFHTSGVKDYEALELIKGKYYFEDHMTNKYVVSLLSKQQTLNFKPNTEYEYSNSNYIILAEIIERISGKTLNEFAKEKIFDPLQMNKTFYNINQGEDFENRAIGYEYIDSQYSRPTYESQLIGDGAIFTTLPDLIQWDQNFFKNKLGNKLPSLLHRMKHREPLINGNLNSMAFAQIFTAHAFGKESWSHGGSGGGYRSFYIRFEKANLSIIVLTNSDEKNAFEISNKIVNILFELKQENASNQNILSDQKEESFIQVSKSTIENFIGFYQELNGLDLLEISYHDEGKDFKVDWLENRDNGYIALLINDTILAEKDDTRYQYEIDQTNNLLIHFEQGKEIKKWRKLDLPVDPLNLFGGSYYSSEVDHLVTFKIVNDKLVTNNKFMNLLERMSNQLFLDKESLAVLTFEIKEDEVTEFIIDIPRGDRSLRNLKFEKK